MDEDADELNTHKKRVINTEEQVGNIWKCMPVGGNFSYVNVDFNGFGGFVQMIDEPESYDQFKSLNLINSLIGGGMQSINVPIAEIKGKELANLIRPLFHEWNVCVYDDN